MISIGEFLLLLAYLAVVLYVASVARRINGYYWLAAVGVVLCYGLLEWQDADVERRIAQIDQQRYAEVAR